jgi:hypothetical protein
MVLAAGAYEFSAAGFEELFGRLEAGVLADVVRLVEVLPLNGFVSNEDEISLGDGLILRPMSDLEMSRAIQFLAVPAEFAGLANSVTVSRFHQWALTIEHRYPLRSYKLGMPTTPKGPLFPVLEEAGERLVAALRISCGGSAVATRPLYLQHEADFPPMVGPTALLSAGGSADVDRPTLLLSPDQITATRELWQILGADAVLSDGALQVALRRFVLAGSKNRVEDRLLDLSICSEALFLKRAGYNRVGKGSQIAVRAEALLAEDELLGVGRGDVEVFMRGVYDLPNAEIHGDSRKARPMRLLDGTTVDRLEPVVEDLVRVLGRAISTVLVEVSQLV